VEVKKQGTLSWRIGNNSGQPPLNSGFHIKNVFYLYNKIGEGGHPGHRVSYYPAGKNREDVFLSKTTGGAADWTQGG